MTVIPRRDALIAAAIAEIGARGSLDVTVAAIARRAGVSTALAHHYFGTKDEILISAMRRILAVYREEVRSALVAAERTRERVDAILRASFAPSNYGSETVTAWLAFYLTARHSGAARRLLAIYHRRLRSNLVHALRPLSKDPDGAAETLAALIDGLYVRQGAGRTFLDPDTALDLCREVAAHFVACEPDE